MPSGVIETRFTQEIDEGTEFHLLENVLFSSNGNGTIDKYKFDTKGEEILGFSKQQTFTLM